MAQLASLRGLARRVETTRNRSTANLQTSLWAIGLFAQFQSYLQLYAHLHCESRAGRNRLNMERRCYRRSVFWTRETEDHPGSLHASSIRRMLKVHSVVPFSPPASQASLQTSILRLRNRTTGAQNEQHQAKRCEESSVAPLQPENTSMPTRKRAGCDWFLRRGARRRRRKRERFDGESAQCLVDQWTRVHCGCRSEKRPGLKTRPMFLRSLGPGSA
jgi:hypothetical protein